MKQFLIRFLLFAIPILLIFIGLELYIRNSQNAFITKANYFKNNKNQIEVLILGSSHHQNGLNPKFFTKKTANISYGSQDIQLDSALFFSNVKQMKMLKKVIFELDYHRLDIQNEPNFYRFPWYYLYYNIEIYPISLLNKISLYSSNTSFFNNVILDKYSKNYKPQTIHENGFVETNYSNEFLEMKYDTVEIKNSAKQRLQSRHKEISNENFKNNSRRIESIINFCKQNNIEIYFLSSPLYKSYIENKITAKDKKVIQFTNALKNKYNINYLDFSSFGGVSEGRGGKKSSKFELTDFSNDDHLNAKGAEKYSKIIDSLISE